MDNGTELAARRLRLALRAERLRQLGPPRNGCERCTPACIGCCLIFDVESLAPEGMARLDDGCCPFCAVPLGSIPVVRFQYLRGIPEPW